MENRELAESRAVRPRRAGGAIQADRQGDHGQRGRAADSTRLLLLLPPRSAGAAPTVR